MACGHFRHEVGEVGQSGGGDFLVVSEAYIPVDESKMDAAQAMQLAIDMDG